MDGNITDLYQNINKKENKNYNGILDRSHSAISFEGNPNFNESALFQQANYDKIN